MIVEGVRSIAVLRANALGDLIVAMPALDALRHRYPTAKITLLGRDWHGPFLAGRPSPVDEVVAVPPIEQRPATPPELIGRFDLAVQLHGGGRNSNPFMTGLGARVTAGLRTPDAPPLDRWVPYLYYQHETLRFLEVAGLVGATPRGLEPSLAVTAADHAELDHVFGEPPPGLVAVHPGATDSRRRWPADRFAEVAARLGRPVVVTGTEPERDLVDEVAARTPGARPVVGALSLGGLAALYARCDLLISNDTGPRHLAAAVGTPTVGVYWCGNLINAGPLTRTRHRPLISWTTDCPDCGRYGMRVGMRDCGHRSSWVADVQVSDVLEQAQDLLANPPKDLPR